MGEITVLGNCSNQTAEFNTVNFVIEEDDSTVLVDAGPGVIQQLYRAGYEARDIDAVFLTHRHSDHILGYPYFVLTVFFELLEAEERHEFKLICSPEIKEKLDDFIEFCSPSIDYNSFSVDFRPVKNFEENFQIGKLNFEVFPVDHAVPAFGLKFEDVIITGDTAPINLEEDCKVLFHEATATDEKKDLMNEIGHSVAKDAGRKASNLEVEKLFLMHPHPEQRDNPEKLLEEAKAEFKGKVEMPRELDKISF